MPKEMTFEEAMKKLEAIVEELEKGGLPIEKSLAKFEEGVKLSRFCTDRLKDVEKKIKILMRTEEGELEEHDFLPEQQEEAQEDENEDEKDEQEDLF